jgi:hypothetical protein
MRIAVHRCRPGFTSLIIWSQTGIETRGSSGRTLEVTTTNVPGSPEAVTLTTQSVSCEPGATPAADRQRLLVLKFTGRMSNAEIGVVMERTEGAIKSLYHRTLIALRRELDQPDGSWEDRETP